MVAKRSLRLSAAIALLLCATVATAAVARTQVEIVVNAESGAVLASKKSRLRVHPASLTKMMTLYLAFDAIERGRLKMGQKLTVSRHAASMPPSELGLRKGRRISVRDAILGTAVKSANDAAVVLAEAIGGTESNFARMMTAKARALGMRDTRFRNASGLTAAGHLSTAEDMAILTRRLWLDHRKHFKIFSKRSVKIGRRRFRTTNTLLGRVRGGDGVKTGYTRKAGHNLAYSARRSGRRVIVVVMGERRRSQRDRRVRRLIEVGFQRIGRKPSRYLRKPSPQNHRASALIAAAPPKPKRRPVRLSASLRRLQPPKLIETASTEADAAQDGWGAAEESWGVQIGAFHDLDLARERLIKIAGMKTPALSGAVGDVSMKLIDGKTVHRARFRGMNEKQAHKACKYLKSTGRECALVPPKGWAL